MIVKCQFKLKSSDGFGGKEYTYLTDLPLKVGDIVRVQAGDSEGIARVSEIDVPEYTIKADLFRVLKHVIGYSDYEDSLFEGEQNPDMNAVVEAGIPSDIIIIRQLPIIEENIRSMKPIIEEKIQEALSLVATEETSAAVRETRNKLNKEKEAVLGKIDDVIDKVEAPIQPIKEAKKEIRKIYEDAYNALTIKINAVDDGVKDEKRKQLREHYEEYRRSKNLQDEEIAGFDRYNPNIRKGDSLKALKTEAEEYLNKIAGDLIAIGTTQYPDELLVEYRKLGNLAKATANVNERHRLAEEQRKRREAEAAAKAEREAREREAVEKVNAALARAEPLAPPVQTEAPKPKKDPNQILTLAFRVTATRAKLIELKKFLDDGGYRYE